MEQFLDSACNWAERNDIPLTAYRAEDGGWFAKLEMKDGLGWFAVHIPIFDAKAKETGGEFQSRVEQRLSLGLVKERERRIKNYTGCDPRKQKAA